MTELEYVETMEQQGGGCAICGKQPSGDKKQTNQLMIDHDHRLADMREAVRSLLCWNCNILIGHAKENPGILRAAADYLEG